MAPNTRRASADRSAPAGEQLLSASLSQLLVAFTIEFDHEFEREVPHRTTDYGATPGADGAPWLVSLAIWRLVLRHVPPDGLAVAALHRRTGLAPGPFRMWLRRLSAWWGYLTLEPGTAEGFAGTVVRPTPGGLRAIAVWSTLTERVERTWRNRFSPDAVSALRLALEQVATALLQSRPAFPDQLPILGFHLRCEEPLPRRNAKPNSPPRAAEVSHDLPGLLSRVLLAFALDVEAATGLSLAASANVLRVGSEEPVRLSELLQRSGIAEAAFSVATKRLAARGLVRIGAVPGWGRSRGLSLTAPGVAARTMYMEATAAVEERWIEEMGEAPVARLRRALDAWSSERAAAALLEGALAPPGLLESKPAGAHQPAALSDADASRWFPGWKLIQPGGKRQTLVVHRSCPRAPCIRVRGGRFSDDNATCRHQSRRKALRHGLRGV